MSLTDIWTDPAAATAVQLALKMVKTANLSDVADAATARANIGAGTSSVALPITQADVTGLVAALAAKQALDATLTALAALTIAADSLSIGTGADAFTQVTFAANTFPAKASTGALVAKTLTDFALTLLDDADAATARATLGITAGGDLSLSKLAPASNVTITAGYSAYVSPYYEFVSAVTTEIGAGSTLEIG